jgi:hypothetical protein
VSSPLTYVYGLVRSARRPSLRGAPDGLPGSRDLRLLDAGDAFAGGGHWLVASTVSEEAYGEAPLEAGLQQIEWVGPRALAHEAVIEHFLDADAVLPMQLFTLFKSDDRALDDVRKNSRRVARILDRINGHVEWGVRLMWNPAGREATVSPKQTKAGAVRKSSAAGESSAARALTARVTSGASYLALKRDLRDRNQADFKRARADAGRLYRSISKKATRAIRRTATEQGPGSRLLLDAAFLVRARNAKGFQAAVQRETRALERKGIAVTLTGPWPAYNFV